MLECDIPKWFYNIYILFKNEVIDITTFINALNYLIAKGVIICSDVSMV